MGRKCGVYLIVSPSNRRYVGSSNDIKERFASYRRLSCQYQKMLYRSLKKYGVDNHKFSILIECKENERLMYERIFGDLYLSLKDYGGLNLNLPGYDEIPKIVSNSTKIKQSVSAKNSYHNTDRGKRMAEATRKRFSNPLEREKSSKKAKERYKNNDIIEKIRVGLKKYYSENPESLKRLSETMTMLYINNPEKSKTVSAKTKEVYKNNPSLAKEASNRAKILFGNTATHPRSIRIIDTKTGTIFNSIKDAAGSINVHICTLWKKLNDPSKNNTNFKIY